MRPKEIYKRFAYYYDEIVEISKIPLMVPLTKKDVNFSRATLQMIYKELKFERENDKQNRVFVKMSVIDYICYISCRYLLDNISRVEEATENKNLVYDISLVVLKSYSDIETAAYRWIIKEYFESSTINTKIRALTEKFHCSDVVRAIFQRITEKTAVTLKPD